MLLVGNDIVDLNKAGYPDKHKNSRFVTRVFSEQEQTAIFNSANQDLTLWMIWAAKETAFKLISKISGPPVFSHKKFQTVLQLFKNLDGISVEAAAQVTYAKQIFDLKIFANIECVHAVGSVQRDGKKSDYVTFSNTKFVDAQERKKWGSEMRRKKHFTEVELASIGYPESALVRFYCKQEVASRLKIEPARLQILRPQDKNKSLPPFLLLDNERVNINLSLSHHGKWLAWIYSLPKSTSADLRLNEMSQSKSLQ